jgi:hypothetical protein
MSAPRLGSVPGAGPRLQPRVGSVTPAELSAAVSAGERAAFHASPTTGIEALTAAVGRAGDEPSAALLRWLLGVCLGATGRYGQAWEVLDVVLAGPPSSPAMRLGSALAASCSASLHRQIGEHARAEELDEQGLAWARTLGAGGTEVLLDCAIGHTADAIGQDDLATARRRLLLVESALSEAGDAARWRPRVRLAWVRAEVALLAGDGRAAVAAASGALELSEAAAAPRHVAKSQLFLGVAQATMGQPGAAATLRGAAAAAEGLGCRPLVWPARAVLGVVLPPGEQADGCLTSARQVVEAIAADLPGELAQRWLARPDIVALRGG